VIGGLAARSPSTATRRPQRLIPQNRVNSGRFRRTRGGVQGRESEVGIVYGAQCCGCLCDVDGGHGDKACGDDEWRLVHVMASGFGLG
jgi:hypothetical protein